jgi:predicted DNA-binding antitoxin AbrB/MazE fold protein
MKETFEAVYEKGVLRPLGKFAAREGQRLRLSIELKARPDAKDQTPRENYDFSDLVGRLLWNGDSLDEQRKLRDEWS